jgi:hypothetical protein
MNSKSLTIGVLSVTAVLLFLAQFMPLQRAEAQVWKDRDYSLVSTKSNRSGELVFVIDNRSGLVAALSWDNAARNFTVDGVGSITEAFR